ncbi:MAG: MnhB domain-containing protein [Kosmotogaceae bacterium]
MNEKKGMTLIVKTVTRFTVWLILLYGIFLIAHGHLTPGGGFVGGLVIALSFIHLTLAFGKDKEVKVPGIHLSHSMEAAGVLIYVGLGIVALVAGLPFLTNFIGKGTLFNLFSSGTIPILNFAIALKVSTGVFLAYLLLVLIEHNDEEEEED